jgi:PAS domain S-box-containing protein
LNPTDSRDPSEDREGTHAPGEERIVPILIAVAFVAAVGVQIFGSFSAFGLGTVVVIGAILLAVSQRFLHLGRTAPADSTEEADGPAPDPARAPTLDAALDCVISIDGDGTIREWNSAARNTFGHRREEAVGRNAGDLLVPPSLRERYLRMVAGAVGAADNPLLNRPIEAVAMHAGGAEFPVELSVSKVRENPPLYTGFVRDISERRTQQQQNERLKALVNTSQDAIVSLDLQEIVTGWSDGARALYGYRAEEALGRSFAELTGPPGATAGALVERIRSNNCEPLEMQRVRRDEASIYVSIRAFPIHDVAGEIVGLTTSATDATERHLREERERKDTEGRLWRGRVEDALANDRFVFWGQPVVSMESGLIHHHELLLRMDLNGELVSPGKFLPHVEGTDLISEIDRWALRQGVDYARRLPVAIKLSAMGLTNREVIEIVSDQLDGGAPPENVILEVMESAAADDLDAVRTMVGELADLGCKVALDDFGTGYGSFSYLKHLPVSQLKIDMQFIRNLVDEEADRLVVRSMITVAENFGLTTVAEGVEDERTLQLLRRLGVDLVQGYHVGYPARMTAAGTGAALIDGTGATSVPKIVIESNG